MPAAVTGALSVGYGMTEAQPDETGAHHRTAVTGAVGVAPLPRLQLSLRAEGRYDSHPDDSQGDNSGTVLSPTLAARWVEPLDAALSLGAGASVWFPGSAAPGTTLAAASPSAIAFGTLRMPPFAITALGGYRLDRSQAASPELSSMRSGDRVALGLSEFDAALFGLGVTCSLGQLRLFAEASADVLVGAGAPPLTQSPLAGSAGARYALDPTWSLELLGSASFSERPGVTAGDPLVPLEPRLAALAGVRLLLPFERAGAAPETQRTALPAAKPVPEPESVTLRVRLRFDLARAVVPNATLERDGQSLVAARAGDRELEFRDQRAGSAVVRVQAEGYHELVESVRIEPEMQPLELELRAVRDAQLRGLVRSLQGRGLRARIRVEPFDLQVETDAEGFFELDVPSGRYAVSVEAEGYQSQRRNVDVERDGVVILNMDLSRH